jgi:hypothetical protein
MLRRIVSCHTAHVSMGSQAPPRRPVSSRSGPAASAHGRQEEAQRGLQDAAASWQHLQPWVDLAVAAAADAPAYGTSDAADTSERLRAEVVARFASPGGAPLAKRVAVRVHELHVSLPPGAALGRVLVATEQWARAVDAVRSLGGGAHRGGC